MKKSKLTPNFGGYATKVNVKCSDGRVILPGAFKHMDGMTVPLVWQHLHDSVSNVLGHALLENREDGVYAYGYLNDSADGVRAKQLIEHKDIVSLSIYANSLVEKSKQVAHGVIREVSLVLSGANPGAKIDYINLVHDDGTEMISEEEAIIHSGELLEIPENDVNEEEEEEFLKEAGVVIHKDKTIADVFNAFSDEQKTVVYAIVSQLMGGSEDDMEQSATDDNSNEGDTTEMKKNVFDGSNEGSDDKNKKIVHLDFSAVMATARELGSLRAAVIKHAGTYGIGSDRTNLELLFPDAQTVGSKEPTWISRRMEWVKVVLASTRHSPFSRIKSLHADITADEARARGYVTGNLKVEEVFPVLRRITTPHTVYKKQKLDRDDILDITDFDVVRWLKAEMRVMLDEEIARAVLVGDGRDPVTEVDDHIPTDNVRPVWGDDAVYVHYEQVVVGRTTDELIDDFITAMGEYRGSGSPTAFMAPSLLTAMLLLRDADGRRLYRTAAELAAELRVSSIVEVPVMEGLNRTPVATQYNLRIVAVNLADYTIGADKGGEVNMFDDFDIDYNQYKYLMETRISGALTTPKSAVILEQANA